MRKILLHVQLIIVVLSSTIYDDCRTVLDEARDCATDGSPNMGDYDCQCRQKYCCYRQTCRPEGDGGKGECKSPVAVAIPAHQRFTKCATDGSPNPDKEACECNFQDAALCQTGQICHPHGCPEGKVCDIVDTRGRAYCERAPPVKAGPKPSAGTTGSNGGSGGGVGGSNGAGGDAGQGPLRCQSGDGALLASATACEDRIDDGVCRAVFSNDGAGVRSSKCDLPGLAETALKCAKTCKICCERAEHGCADDGTFGIDCTSQKSKCKDPQWTAVMSHACPSTCGLCDAGACSDVIDGCASLKPQCRDYAFRDYMSKNCARTCQACDYSQGSPSGAGAAADVHASKCDDAGANCAAFVGRCNDPDWQTVLRSNCARTCGLC